MQLLTDAVDAEFAVTASDHHGWPDPHPDRSPADEEYSRVTGPSRWRILGDRADAWTSVLAGHGLAMVEPRVAVAWAASGSFPDVTRADRLVPSASGAVSLVIARSRIDSVPDAGVTLGVSDPAIPFAWIPDCGCDACDSGSQDALDELDSYIGAIVDGSFRYLWRGARNIMVTGDGMRRGSGLRGREVAAVLADPAGWREISGVSWLDGAR